MNRDVTINRPHRRLRALGRKSPVANDQVRELIEVQRELEVSRQHYADLFDLAPVGFITLTLSGCIRDINLTGAAMLGVDRAQLIGRPLMTMFIKPDRIRFLQHLSKLRRGEASTIADLTIADRN